MENFQYILPEIFISVSIMLFLLVGVFKKNSASLIYNLSNISLVILLALIINISSLDKIYLFNESYLIDNLSNYMKIILVGSGIFVMLTGSKYIQVINLNKIEYPILILSSILSALSSGLLLYGCSLTYGFSESTNFDQILINSTEFNYGTTFGIVFILVGLAFKISAVPFHMWAPDVYQGSPTSVTLFFAILPKIAALSVFIKFLYTPFANMNDQWQTIIVFISIASMIFGAVAAIGQKNLKRLIAYSSISHMGYALAGLATVSNQGIQSSITYISIYLVMNLAFFSCLFMLKRNDKYYENIEDLSGLSKKHPILSFSLLIVLFSLAGIPPLAGFFAKFYVFLAVIEQSMYFLAIVGLLATVVAAFYYLRIIKIIYFDPEKEEYETSDNLGLKITLAISTIFILAYFIYPSGITEIVSKITMI